MRKFLITTLFIGSTLMLSMIYLFNVNNLNLHINVSKPEFNEVMVYFVFEDNLTPVSFNISNENVVNETFDFLTVRKNNAPLGHLSKVPVNTRLLDYQIIGNNRLVLNITDHILNMNERNQQLAVNQIISSYTRQGFNDVILVNNNQIINIL